jgi:hypothetical protein
MHFTPTSASWLNMVERFFRDITDKRIRATASPASQSWNWPSTCTSPHHNIDPKPFIWTAERQGHPGQGHVSSEPVVPLGRRFVESPAVEVVRAGAELRVVADLRALAAAVSRSSLSFSCIRLRNL